MIHAHHICHTIQKIFYINADNNRGGDNDTCTPYLSYDTDGFTMLGPLKRNVIFYDAVMHGKKACINQNT